MTSMMQSVDFLSVGPGWLMRFAYELAPLPASGRRPTSARTSFSLVGHGSLPPAESSSGGPPGFVLDHGREQGLPVRAKLIAEPHHGVVRCYGERGSLPGGCFPYGTVADQKTVFPDSKPSAKMMSDPT
jgi:hypothetical protein